MLLWLVFALLAAGVVAVLLRPLLGAAGTSPASHAEGRRAVYLSQLSEIDAEVRGGGLTPDEAEAARREIARRLLSAAAEVSATASSPAPVAPADAVPASRRGARLAAAIGLLLPATAVTIYLLAGSPGLEGQPLASRRTPLPASTDVARLVSTVEARLRSNPDDGRGWDVIAPVYLRLERYAQAADAYERAARLLGETPARLAGLAEAMMLANDGRVTEVVRNALEKLLRLEPDNLQARFWLAYAKEQDGRLEEAAAAYEQLRAMAPADAAWRETLDGRQQAVRAALAARSGPAGVATTTDQAPARAQPSASPTTAAAPRGPTQADIEAAERLSAADRAAMIDAMVSGLAARLERNGRDLEGWQRLIRALNTLGRKDDAIAALGRARKSFEGEAQPLAELAELSRALGLGS